MEQNAANDDDNNNRQEASGADLLPREMWARVTEYLAIDDLMNLRVGTQFFLQKVSPLVQHISVKRDEDLVGLAVRNRFPAVTHIQVDCSLDCVYENLFDFLSSFPKLEYAYVIPTYKAFKLNHFEDIGRMQRILTLICDAYASGRWKSTVRIDGLGYYCNDRCCPYFSWTREGPCVRYEDGHYTEYQDGQHRDCLVCSMMCRSFCPVSLLEMHGDCLPCIPVKQRLQMAWDRLGGDRLPGGRGEVRYDLNRLLLCHLYNRRHLHYALNDKIPLVSYDEATLSTMEWMIEKGASIDGPKLRKYLSEDKYGVVRCRLYPSLLTQPVLSKFLEWGILPLSDRDYELFFFPQNSLDDARSWRGESKGYRVPCLD